MLDVDAFTVRVIEADDEVRVLVCGDIDLASAPMLSAAIDDAASRGSGRVVVDLSAAPFIDSCGISALVRAQHHLDGWSALLLRSPTTQARKVFAVTGVDHLLMIED